MTDVKTCLNEAQEKMDMATMYLEESLAHIRAGKADTRLLDGIRVDSYGSLVPINNVASITTPDARSIAIKPWDKSMFRVIEKAIIDSSLGIMPENNGEIIRIGIPPLTEATLLIGTILPYDSTRIPSSKRTSALPARMCANDSSKYMVAMSIFSCASLRQVLTSVISFAV